MSKAAPETTPIHSFGEKLKAFEENRYRWTADQLKPYSGQWLAFSGDGRSILANAMSLADVERQLAAKGLDPQEAMFEHLVVAEDSWNAGAELETS